MSKVDRLLIQGIRSFDPGSAEVIRIYSPLTLIVGTNGSGKTTIIECLRFITTGELPPNSAIGGAWIHDPNLVGEKEVLAKVKMSFFSPSGQYMIIDRKLQLTQKGKTRSQKTLDGTLCIKNPSGEETVISSRVAELEQLMPQFLGVPKAILDSVIFCHQDDSLWPMSTPALLKKKFDEIFEAQKYSKAVDQIKVIKKQKTKELGKMQVEEKYTKAAKSKGADVEKKMEDLFHGIEALRERHTGVGRALDEAIFKSKEAWDHAAKFEKILSDLQSKQDKVETLTEYLQNLSQTMKKRDESDAELQRMQDQYESIVEQIALEKKTVEKQYIKMNESLMEKRQSLGQKQRDVGMYQNAMQQYERQIESRRSLVKETAIKHQVRGFDLDVTDTQVDEFVDILRRLIRDQKSACDRAREDAQAELAEAQSALSTLSGQRTSLTSSKENARSQINSTEQRILSLRCQLDTIDVDVGTISVIEARVKEMSTKLQSSGDEMSKADWNGQLDIAERNVSSLTEKKDRLNAEQAEASRHAANFGQLDYLEKELIDRKRSLLTNSKTYNQNFKDLFQDDWTAENLEEKYRALLSEREDSVKSLEARRDRLQSELHQHNFKMSEATKSLDVKRKQVSAQATQIRDTIEDEPAEFPTALKELEDSWEATKNDQTSYALLEDYYKNCLDYSTKKNECKLCERKFKDANEKSKFSKRLQALMRRKADEAAKEELQELKLAVKNARDVRSIYDDWTRLSAEIPSLEDSLRLLEKDKEHLNAGLEEADEFVHEQQSKLHEAEALRKAVQSITKCSTDIFNYQGQLKELQAKQRNFGNMRSTTAIQAEIEQVSNELKQANSELGRIRPQRERAQAQLNSLKFDAQEAASNFADAQHKLNQKNSLDNQIAENNFQIQTYRDTVKQTDAKIQALSPEISEAQSRIHDVTSGGNDTTRALQDDLAKLKDSMSRLELAGQDIEAFIARGGPAMLSNGTREQVEIESQIEALQAALVKHGREVKRAEEKLQNTDNEKRSIADNIAFRTSNKVIQELNQEIENLQSSNAAQDKDYFTQQGEEWQIKRNSLSAEQASISAELRTRDDQFQELQAEWEAEYKNAVQNYRKAHVNVEVTKLVVEDLGRYAGALDKAIMKYHSIKMEEINRIIEELWRKTYRGADVDSIMIKSENETQRGNKSYNYRVVMKKQEAEMDMRGRCSAGQKVLASIIIRLALAECFSVNCGLIALDEPTTNLDRDNIRSLATSLNELIKMRRKQSNFQLVIITHDEEFLRYMNCAELCDEYFRVSRNDRQKSQIVKQSIAEVYR